jgi:hypothetical protein
MSSSFLKYSTSEKLGREAAITGADDVVIEGSEIRWLKRLQHPLPFACYLLVIP